MALSVSTGQGTGIAPHGGALVELLADADRSEALAAAAPAWPVWDLTRRQLCDLELLLVGAMSPLTGFMGRADYESVCATMRLADGTLWPMPITLDVPAEVAVDLAPGSVLALRDTTGTIVAVVHVDDVWQPDLEGEAVDVYRSTSRHHPGVAHLLDNNHWYVGGRVEGISMPDRVHGSSPGGSSRCDRGPLPQSLADASVGRTGWGHLCATPRQLRAEFAARGWDRVVAFHTRNPMHRAHFELTVRASAEVDANLLLHPVVGMTKPGDLDAGVRMRCYQAVMDRYPRGTALLAAIPTAMRMSGPRDALWNAIVRKNYGATHYIVGRDHASPGDDLDGTPFYGPYDCQDLLHSVEDELGVTTVGFPAVVYVPELDRYLPEAEVPSGLETRTVSGTLVRALLAQRQPLPEWISFPEVSAELVRRDPDSP